MIGSRNEPARSIAERCYRVLLHAYPPGHRRRFGHDMSETFARDHARVRLRGAAAMVPFWIVTIVQAVWFGAAARAHGWKEIRVRRLIHARLDAADLLRYSARQFRRQPLYAFGCAATLALGIAAATASFAVAKRALLDPLPYENDHELVSLLTSTESGTSAVSAHVLEDLRRASPPFTGLAPIRPQAFTHATEDSTQSVGANAVTREYFDVLGVRPALGRTWTEHERDAIVVSWGFWQRTFGGDPGALGRRITLDGAPRTVVGVMPPDFVPPYWTATAVWCPVDVAALVADPARARRTLTVLARRAPAASEGDVNAFLDVFGASQRRRFPSVFGQHAWVAEPLRKELIGPARPALIGTAVAAAILLLIVCANIAGLTAVRASGRQQQVAIRSALGATRGRLFLERLSDILVIAIAGSLAGVGLAGLVVELAAGYQQQFLGRLPSLSLDRTTAAGGFFAGLLVSSIAAMVPQRVTQSARAIDWLKSARGTAVDARSSVTRSVLVAVQVALALTLTVGAGLLVRTVASLDTMSLGFRASGLTTFSVNLAGQRYQSRDSQIQFERDVLERLHRIPGVESASASVGVPVIGGMGAGLHIEGRTNAAAEEIAYFSVSPEFMTSFDVPLKAGRSLAATDTAAAPRVVVINETMARRYWPEGNAIGARVQIGPGTATGNWITIVGIVADMRQHGPTEDIRPTAFGSTLQYSWPRRHFTVRTTDAAASLATDLRAVVRSIDPSLAIGVVTPIEQLVAERTARHRLAMLSLSFFGLVALALCALGLYAVVALGSQLRRREYAIRMALGAPRTAVRMAVIKHALLLGAAGALAGLGVSAIGTRALQGMLHGVTPVDPFTFGAATAAILTLACVAAAIPARQAGRVDPVEALRVE